MLTVKDLVNEIRVRPDFQDGQDLRKRVGKIILHQYYILVAPFGAMFVYRGLVATNQSESDVTVGLAAFGAGLALNIVIKQAMRLAGVALKPIASKEPEGASKAAA